MRYHRLTPVRMANINNSGNNRCWWGCRERGTFLHCWWECKLVQPLWKTVWRFLKKLKIELPSDPAIALLGIYPKNTGVLSRRGTCTPMFIAALLTTTKVWKKPRCPSTDEWIKKMAYIFIYMFPLTHNGVLLGNQKEWNLAICNNVDGTRVYYPNRNKSEKDKYMISLIFGI